MNLQPEDVQTWFPPALQRQYVDHLLMQSNSQSPAKGKKALTPEQAGHLVRLWGYAYIQHYGDAHVPFQRLTCRLDSFFCSYSEAARLFYADRDQGEARSAGEMLKRLASTGLIQCTGAKGRRTQINLNISQNYELPEEYQDEDIFADAFDPRRDAPKVAKLLTVLFHYDAAPSQFLERDITRVLREWAKRYPEGLRILRSAKDQKPIAVATIFPIHPDSEPRFGAPPSHSMYLHRTQQRQEDPIQFAERGCKDCYIAYIRCWHIKPGFWHPHIILQLMQETRTMLQQMQQDYPELCDVYSLILHPRHEDLAIQLGFETMCADPNMAQRWAYIALDDFLELDAPALLDGFDFGPYNRSSFI